ncbi:hypothetical protein Q6249_28330, partial [Klebsiella pneumoniae]|uniref:hypothetical protein n=1 Tax=Klebsiella pneumoniae TaxID=573 RepID=UPI002732071D
MTVYEPELKGTGRLLLASCISRRRCSAVDKKLGMAPRQLAEQVLSHLDLNGIANKVEIAGLGIGRFGGLPGSMRCTGGSTVSGLWILL